MPIAGIAGLGALGARELGFDVNQAGVVDKVQGALTYAPRTEAGQAGIATVGVPFDLLARGADYVGDFVNRTTGNAGAATAVNTAIQSLPSIFLRGGAKPAGVVRNGNPPMGGAARPAPSTPKTTAAVQSQRPAGLGRVSEQAPSKEALKAASTAAYKRAEKAGGVIKEDSFSKARSVISQRIEKLGIDKDLHPDSSAVLKRVSEEKGPITFEKLETLRRLAKDAEGSQKPADALRASEIVDIIDDYADTISRKDLVSGSPKAAKAYKEARGLYSRARKAADLDELMRRAEIRAGANYTVSGLENALRGEFKTLALNPKRMRRFTAEERAAIERVAKGGKIENALRLFGKFAPTGNISFATSAGAGFLAGGPVGAVALPIAGAASRYGAARMTVSNAARANEIVRRGPPQRPKSRDALPDKQTERR